VSLEELGMSAEMLDTYRRLAVRAHGIVLSTGPTGSGKTTTLYAALGLRRPAEEKIVTVEDPVEYHLSGVTQVPVHTKSGMTFAAALRSILRQDPDVMMIGEMRDAETAAIAVQAAMTGHLVFSTLHTNDAISAITRLVDLKIEPYMIAATVEGVLAQRLVRKVCSECRDAYQPDSGVLALFQDTSIASLEAWRAGKGHRFSRGKGCGACRQTGYRGRTGIYELLVVSDGIRQILLRNPDVGALRAAAREQGMRTLREDGWSKVQAGITTVEEVLRVVD
jgi:type II secretory ATPase GspE/PulE/Tfp pilus assembly ATPase PilB-like protein